jgi:hypothetical protein
MGLAWEFIESPEQEVANLSNRRIRPTEKKNCQ